MTMANRAFFGDEIGNLYRANGATKLDAAGRRVTHYTRILAPQRGQAEPARHVETGNEWALRLAGKADKIDPSWKGDPSAKPGALFDGPSWSNVTLVVEGETGDEWAARLTGKKL